MGLYDILKYRLTNSIKLKSLIKNYIIKAATI